MSNEIEKLYVIVTNYNGVEGIATIHQSNGQMIQAITPSLEMITKIENGIRKSLAQSQGHQIKVLEFSKRKDITKTFNKNIIII